MLLGPKKNNKASQQQVQVGTKSKSRQMFTSSHTLAAAAHHVVLHAKVDSLSITTVTTAKAVVAVFPKRRKKP